MERRSKKRVCLAGAALAVTMALTGCTIPFVNYEFDLPFDLPQFELPDLDLDELPIPEFTLPIGVTTTVDDARIEVLGSKSSTLSDEALVMPGYLTVGVKTATSSAPLCVEDEYGTLFAVYEAASVEAGQILHPGEDWGDGWLFSIRQVTPEELITLLCGYMFGEEVFATDGEYYYLFCTPTDVRLMREDDNYDEESIAMWTELNEWAATVPETFLEDNPDLIPSRFGNSDVDVLLYRLYFMEEDYELFHISEGTLGSSGVDPSPYLETLLQGDFEALYDEGNPDGEYYSLNIPEENTRLDFFISDGNYIRLVYDDIDYSLMFRATYPDDTQAYQVLESWYKTLMALN